MTNFDRLARAGTDVHYSITCQPVCGPARSCLQTGLYATETGCYRNGIPLPSESHAHLRIISRTPVMTPPISANGICQIKAMVRSLPSSAAVTNTG